MPQRFSGAVVTVACPQCDTHNTQTAENLWAGRQLSCSQCHARLTVDVDQLNMAVARMATAANALTYRIAERLDGAMRVLIAH